MKVSPITRLSIDCVTTRLLALLLSIWLTGCASYSPPAPTDTPSYLDRMETKVDGDIHVSTVVLTAEESKQSFGTNLAGKGIQPIYFEIDNREEFDFTMMTNSVDSNYFSPSEAAWLSRRFGESKTDVKALFFLKQHLPVMVSGKSKVTGFVYTNLSPGGKAFGLTLVKENDLRHFEFVQEIPGLQLDWAHIVIIARPGWELPRTGEVAHWLTEHRLDDRSELRQRPTGGIVIEELRPLAISATEIRQMLEAGQSARYLLPQSVLDYIQTHQLYS